MQTYPSPDGRYVVEVFYVPPEVPEHTDSFNVYAAIRKSGDTPLRSKGYLEQKDILISLFSSSCVSCRWLTAQHLVIDYCEGSKFVPAKFPAGERWADVVVSGRKIAEPLDEAGH
jgi:hypothetical protein